MQSSYHLEGRVEAGQGAGEKLGAKTANLPIILAEAQAMPQGLYRCTVTAGETHWRGLLYYGINSLTNSDCLEVHLFDFAGDLYGKIISVMTEGFVRPPERFTSEAALADRIRTDLNDAQHSDGSALPPEEPLK